jgi:hypothetical protein
MSLERIVQDEGECCQNLNGVMPGVMVYTCNPSNWKAEAVWLWVWGHPGLHSETLSQKINEKNGITCNSHSKISKVKGLCRKGSCSWLLTLKAFYQAPLTGEHPSLAKAFCLSRDKKVTICPGSKHLFSSAHSLSCLKQKIYCTNY